MKKYFKVFSSVVVLAFFITSCGGGGSGGSGSFSSADGKNGRVEGNISSLSAGAPVQRKTLFSYLDDLLNLTKAAVAQEGEFCGISVMVKRGNEIIATTESSCDGSFTLEDINPGEALLVFELGGVDMSLPVNIPPGGTVRITVSLEDTGVRVNRLKVISGPVNCDEGLLELGGSDVDEIIIEGDGQNCINAEGICTVNLIAGNIDLHGCNFCIRSNDESAVNLIVESGDFDCASSDDGINTNGSSFVGISAAESINIHSDNEDGIDASGNSGVNLDSKQCRISGLQNSILRDTDESVNTERCGSLVEESGEHDGEPGDNEDDGESEHDENMGDEMEEEPSEPGHGACEFDCFEDDCELFCNSGIPAECVDVCSFADNFSLCIQECTGYECGDAVCNEYCAERESECEIKEVCEEVCETEPVCEEVCVERECIEFACDEICVERECLAFACEEVCEGEGEQQICEEVCGDDCIEFGECIRFEEECGDDCIEFGECVRFEEVCECENETVECGEEEVCEEVCVQEALGCRFECEERI